MKPCFVGIDTSNYTTSVAVCDGDGNVIANLKAPLAVAAGERGLRQSDAVFAHVKNLPMLMCELRDALSGREPIAVGVSVSPRDADGSYMPCFLSGKSAAYSFAAGRQIPVYEFSHQSGHIMAALYSSGRLELLESERLLAFHVSGGTTEAVIARPCRDGFSVELVGRTADVSCGQVIDRVGVAMGLGFPCGRELESLAKGYTGRILKRNVCVRDGVCNLSGVENMAARLYAECGEREAVAAFVFDFLGRSIRQMCLDVLDKHGDMPVLFAGGVMSNTLMRDMLSQGIDASFCEPAFSADNAAGTALLCRRAHMARNGE